MKLVLDTNVVMSLLLWGGSPAGLYSTARERGVKLQSSPPLIEELRKVIGRPEFGPRVHATGRSVEELVALYAVDVWLVHPVSVQGLAPDPQDDVVIGTAMAAKAEFLVTGDKGLLSVREYECGRIVTVAEAIQVVEQMNLP